MGINSGLVKEEDSSLYKLDRTLLSDIGLDNIKLYKRTDSDTRLNTVYYWELLQDELNYKLGKFVTCVMD